MLNMYLNLTLFHLSSQDNIRFAEDQYVEDNDGESAGYRGLIDPLVLFINSS